MKKIAVFILLFFLFLPLFLKAEEEKKVKYKDNLILDRDLDGLTDEGENQIFKTDSSLPDTDSDGILDGAEILGKTNPNDPQDPKAREVILPKPEKESPLAWYITRISALLGFVLLYLSFVFGLSIRFPVLKNIINSADSFSIHSWISIQALFFALAHGISLVFDKFLGLSFLDVFLPNFLGQNENLIRLGISEKFFALGIISFYIMLVLVVTSYLRKYIGQKIWRFVHFFNIALYVFVVTHALALGTDLKNPIARNIFIGANAFLGILIIVNLGIKLKNRLFRKDVSEISNPQKPDLENE